MLHKAFVPQPVPEEGTRAAPAPPPRLLSSPGACCMSPGRGWESGAKEEGSKRTEEACSPPGPGPLSAPAWPSRGVGDTGHTGEPRR